MILKSERANALAISQRIMAALIKFPVVAGPAGADLRSAVGKYMANFTDLIDNQIVGTQLFDCFEKARAAGATLNSMDGVRTAMFAETLTYRLGMAIANAAIIFSFVEQSQIISVTEFASRIEVDALMDRMTVIIEDIKLNKADSFETNDYQNFVSLSALLIQHLSSTERQLPRVIQYHMPINYPALSLSNRIYGDGTHSDELIAENQTVHPLFMQRDIIALGVV